MCLVHESVDRPRLTLSDSGHVREAVIVVRIVFFSPVCLSFAFGSGIFYCLAPICIYFNILEFSDFCFVLWLLGCEIYFLKVSRQRPLCGWWRMPWFAPWPFRAGSPELGVAGSGTFVCAGKLHRRHRHLQCWLK